MKRLSAVDVLLGISFLCRRRALARAAAAACHEIRSSPFQTWSSDRETSDSANDNRLKHLQSSRSTAVAVLPTNRVSREQAARQNVRGFFPFRVPPPFFLFRRYRRNNFKSDVLSEERFSAKDDSGA